MTLFTGSEDLPYEHVVVFIKNEETWGMNNESPFVWYLWKNWQNDQKSCIMKVLWFLKEWRNEVGKLLYDFGFMDVNLWVWYFGTVGKTIRTIA